MVLRHLFSDALNVARDRVSPIGYRRSRVAEFRVRQRAKLRTRCAQLNVSELLRYQARCNVEVARQLAREVEPRAVTRIDAVIKTSGGVRLNQLTRRPGGIDYVRWRNGPIDEGDDFLAG